MSEINNEEKKSLLESKRKWEHDIQKYKKFLEGEVQTFEAKFGAQEYIALAQNRIEAIDLKLKRIL
tara:strand:+ start:458 stop:655 length:198 start_codon:yes stop_codon:yes gene_type:complete